MLSYSLPVIARLHVQLSANGAGAAHRDAQVASQGMPALSTRAGPATSLDLLDRRLAHLL